MLYLVLIYCVHLMPSAIFINLGYEPLKKGWKGLTNCGKNRNHVSIEAILHSVLPTFPPDHSSLACNQDTPWQLPYPWSRWQRHSMYALTLYSVRAKWFYYFSNRISFEFRNLHSTAPAKFRDFFTRTYNPRAGGQLRASIPRTLCTHS